MRNPRATIATLLIILASITGALILHSQAGVRWIINLKPDNVVMGEPVNITVWAYDPGLAETYTVSCNITIVSDEAVVLQDSFTGKPAVYTIELWEEGNYTAILYCATLDAPEENTAVHEEDFQVRYPALTVSPLSPLWARPFTLTIKAEYPYNNVPVIISYGNLTGNFTMQGGTLTLDMPPTYEETPLTIKFLGRTLVYSVKPTPPSLVLGASNSTVMLGDSFSVTPLLQDKMGVLDIEWPVSISVEGPCEPNSIQATTQQAVTFRATGVGSCIITANADVYVATLSTITSVAIVPPKLLSFNIYVSNTTPWDYVLRAEAYFERPIPANVSIYLDDKLVAIGTGYTAAYTVEYQAALLPGQHVVRAVLVAPGYNLERVEWLTVPRHPYVIEPPPRVILAGEEITVSNAYYYVYYTSEDEAVVVAYYPGDDYYAPAKAVFHVTIIYPVITVTENRITVSNGAPGSKVSVYCELPSGREAKLLEAILQDGRLDASLPDFDCLRVWAVYEYGSYKSVATANEPEPIQVLSTTCTAGAQCVILAPSPAIREAYIGWEPYTPGEPVVLEPGVYTLTVITRDGFKLVVPVTVLDPGPVYVYTRACEPSHVVVAGPPGVPVVLVLESGRTVTVEPGEYYMPEPVVNAYSQYATVYYIEYNEIPACCVIGG